MSSNMLSEAVLSVPEIASGVFTDTPSRDVAVSVRGLAKSYSIAKNAEKHSTLGEALVHKLKNPFAKAEKDTFWALNDVNFDIQKGDVVGIIGRNGAGKSTLLKVLSRITEPTRGKIDLYGRVGSLLEVGTGFHPELTGRENVFLNGAILGMSKAEIARQFDAIVDFSGTEQFLDTPVKRYSSGMYVRLAFAVAAHLNPEILIVDEVLAVGDAEFQKKCMGKMQDVAESGRTVLFVSHNMGAINQLCTQGILLKSGRVEFQGKTEQVTERYLSAGTSFSHEVEMDINSNPESPIVFTRAWMTNDQGSKTAVINVLAPFAVNIEVLARRHAPGVELTALFYNSLGQCLFMSNVSDLNEGYTNFSSGVHTLQLQIPAEFLVPDSYYITLVAHKPMVETYDRHDEVISFQVEETGSQMSVYSGVRHGNIIVKFPWLDKS